MNERVSIPDFEAAFYIADPVAQTVYGEMRLSRHEIGNLIVTSGKIVACDGLIPSLTPFINAVPPGIYPVTLSVVEENGTTASALLKVRDVMAVTWEAAIIESRGEIEFRSCTYAVDSGVGCFADLQATQHLCASSESYARLRELHEGGYEGTCEGMNYCLDDNTGLNVIFFTQGKATVSTRPILAMTATAKSPASPRILGSSRRYRVRNGLARNN